MRTLDEEREFDSALGMLRTSLEIKDEGSVVQWDPVTLLARPVEDILVTWREIRRIRARQLIHSGVIKSRSSPSSMPSTTVHMV